MDVGLLQKFREGNRLEFKRAQGGLPRSFWETYSAFANTNGGLIVLGADERTDGYPVPTGITNPDELVKVLWNGLNNPERASANSAGKPDPLLEELWEPDRVRLTLQLETNGLTDYRLPGMGGETSPLVTELKPPLSDQTDVGNAGNHIVSDPVGDQVTQSSDPVEKLLSVLGNEEMSIDELMQKLGLEHRTNFRRNYLTPALEQGFIERTIPDKPTSSKQKYRRVKR